MAKVGRPRTAIDEQEMFGAFADMDESDRESALKVMTAVHRTLSKPKTKEPKAPLLNAGEEPKSAD